MAMYTHHTTTRPKFPPGSVNKGTFTLSRYLPQVMLPCWSNAINLCSVDFNMVLQMSVQGGASIIFLLDKKSGKTLCARGVCCVLIFSFNE